MTLVEALRELRYPRSGDEDLRREAMQTVYQALLSETQSGRKGRNRADLEEVPGQVLVKLIDAGKDDPESLPDTEGKARAYLRTAIRNNLIDAKRRRRQIDFSSDVERESSFVDTAEQAAAREELAQLDSARVDLFDRIIPPLAARQRYGPDLLQIVGELREVSAGRRTSDDLVTEEAGRDTSPEERKRARYRLDQRISRTLRRVRDEIERLENAGERSPDECELLRVILATLRLRR